MIEAIAPGFEKGFAFLPLPTAMALGLSAAATLSLAVFRPSMKRGIKAPAGVAG